MLRPAADHQDKVGKGEVELPAREMIADILRLSGEPAASRTEYEVSLKTDPGRLTSLLHAEQTAYKIHRDAEGKAFASQLAHNTAQADPAVKVRVRHMTEPVRQAALAD